MTYIQHFKKFLVILIICCLDTSIWAQTLKEISVSQGKSYIDHISLREDSKDMDLMAKFIFNESNNTLTVSLISYRDLFVFQTETPLKQAIKNRKIKPDKLPFVVNTDPNVKYQLTKEYWQAIPKPRKRKIFKKWIEYSGLHPIPTEYKMVNDFIQQDFTILNKADAVSLTLHDVLMLDQEATTETGKRKYDVVWGKDLGITYRIYIERNPCFGKEEEIATAQKQLESIKNGYKNMAERFGTRVVNNQESFNNFKEMKKLLLGQYQKITEKSKCPDIQDCWDSYNLYVDSIGNMRCRIRGMSYTGTSRGNTGRANNGKRSARIGVNSGFILTQARRIDSAVSRWLVSKDPVERADLIKQCQDVIRMVKIIVAQNGVTSNSQRNAINIFNQAARYYHITCQQ